MKKTVIECDYCKETIEKDDMNAIINGNGHIYIVLKNDPLQLFPEDTGYNAMFSVKLGTTSNKHLERDICYNCLQKILKNAKRQNHGSV